MKALLFSFVSLLSFSALGQSYLLQEANGKYYYNERIYQPEELSQVYKIHQESLDLYISGVASKKTGNALMMIGFPMIIGGFLVISSDSRDINRFAALSIITGTAIEIIAIVPRISGDRKLQKAMDTFNYEIIQHKGYHEDISLSLGLGANGIALVYSF